MQYLIWPTCKIPFIYFIKGFCLCSGRPYAGWHHAICATDLSICTLKYCEFKFRPDLKTIAHFIEILSEQIYLNLDLEATEQAKGSHFITMHTNDCIKRFQVRQVLFTLTLPLYKKDILIYQFRHELT